MQFSIFAYDFKAITCISYKEFWICMKQVAAIFNIDDNWVCLSYFINHLDLNYSLKNFFWGKIAIVPWTEQKKKEELRSIMLFLLKDHVIIELRNFYVIGFKNWWIEMKLSCLYFMSKILYSSLSNAFKTKNINQSIIMND